MEDFAQKVEMCRQKISQVRDELLASSGRSAKFSQGILNRVTNELNSDKKSGGAAVLALSSVLISAETRSKMITDGVVDIGSHPTGALCIEYVSWLQVKEYLCEEHLKEEVALITSPLEEAVDKNLALVETSCKPDESDVQLENIDN